MSNLNADALSRLTFGPESEAIYNRNKDVLHTFDQRTSDNFLGIILASGEELSRVEGKTAWLTQWSVRNPDLAPLVNTLAMTFNTALAACLADVQRSEQGDLESLGKALQSVSETKRLLSELELIRDSYLYRFGDVPNGDKNNLDQTIQSALPWSYRRAAGTVYAAQNAVLSQLNTVCMEYRRTVNQIVATWHPRLITFIQSHPELLEEVFSNDPTLSQDKDFILTLLRNQEIDHEQRNDIYALCHASLQEDPDIQAILFITPSERREVSEEERAKASALNAKLVDQEDISRMMPKMQSGARHPQEVDEKH